MASRKALFNFTYRGKRLCGYLRPKAHRKSYSTLVKTIHMDIWQGLKDQQLNHGTTTSFNRSRMRFYVVLFSVQNKQNSRSLECHSTEHSRWVYRSAWTSDPSLIGPNPFDERRVSHSFCGGSLADVSVTALSEQMLFKRREAKSNAPLRSPMCVVCRSVSGATRAQMTERNQTCEPRSSKWALSG